MAESAVAQMLLSSAQQDLSAAKVLAQTPGLADALVGFHAQQAVEKALKAVLSARGIVFRRTHDIAWLLDLLSDSTGLAPPHADWLDELNPYAVDARYGGFDEGGLDRELALEAAESVVRWACSITGVASE